MKPRILMIHTGGTLGMAPQGHPSSLAPGPSLERILEQVPELAQVADLRLAVPFNRDSASMEPEYVLQLARLLREGLEDCQGAVVVHGTDTMAFTSSVLGFLLADLGRPVVLTGSQRPLAYVRSDARSNLVDAVSIAAQGVPEVGICFGDHWLRGVACDKVSVHRYQAFESPNLPPLAELGLTITFHPHAGTFPRRTPAWIQGVLEPAIDVRTPFPGMPWLPLGEGTRGVVIQAFGAGNLPMERSDLRAFLGTCRERGVPVVVVTQCLSGGVDLQTYDLGRQARDLGAIPGGRHTRWAAVAKLSLVLGNGGGIAEAEEAFATSWAGEPL
ncbi:MAG TPA: asparaginase [Holophaga sp.]|nr:asparaginase [Holophaga sp.]